MPGEKKMAGTVDAGSIIYEVDNGKVISNKDMQGSGGLNVQVVINNQVSNAEPQYMGVTQNDGSYVLEFLISDAERNGPYISTLQSTLGLSRKANGAF